MSRKIGEIFGTSEIIEILHSTKKHRFYRCKCTNCGNIFIKRGDSLKSKNRSCRKCFGNYIIPKLDSVRNVLYSHYRTAAISRNWSFNLTDEQFNTLIYGNCFYCGEPPCENKSDLRYNKTDKKFLRNGIDRVDTNKGYDFENCVLCCTMCNRMKLNFEVNNFLSQVSKIYQKHLKEGSTTISKESTS